MLFTVERESVTSIRSVVELQSLSAEHLLTVSETTTVSNVFLCTYTNYFECISVFKLGSMEERSALYGP